MGVGCGQSIFTNELVRALPRLAPDVDAAAVVKNGAYGIAQAFPDPKQLHEILQSYIVGLRAAWAFSIALSGAALIAAFLPRWENIVKVRAAKMATATAAPPAKV